MRPVAVLPVPPDPDAAPAHPVPAVVAGVVRADGRALATFVLAVVLSVGTCEKGTIHGLRIYLSSGGLRGQ